MNDLSVNGLQMTLEGLSLGKYIPLLEKKHIKFDTFVCMSKEDFEYIGITDEDDVKAILNGVAPLKELFNEINNLRKPKLEAVLANNLHGTRPLLGLMKLMKKQLRSKTPDNVFLDSSRSASFIVLQNLKKIDDELENLKKECMLALDVKPPPKSFSTKGTICLFGCIAVAALASLIIFKLKNK